LSRNVWAIQHRDHDERLQKEAAAAVDGALRAAINKRTEDAG